MKKVLEIPKRHIILGKTALSKDKFSPIANHGGLLKPFGGLWASPYISHGNFLSGWHKWCVREQENWLTNDSVILDIKDDTKFFVINSQKDLIQLFDIAGEFTNNITGLGKSLDFEKASTIFDVIYLTDKGQWETRLPHNKPQYSLHGWDCESMLIMNFDCIEKWEYQKLDIV